jgi:hypothetical protein
MVDEFGLWFRLPRKSQGSLTCRKSATWDRRLYFLSEGRRAVDFFARKIRRLRPDSNPRSWVPQVSMLTTRPPNPPLVCRCFPTGACPVRIATTILILKSTGFIPLCLVNNRNGVTTPSTTTIDVIYYMMTTIVSAPTTTATCRKTTGILLTTEPSAA